MNGWSFQRGEGSGDPDDEVQRRAQILRWFAIGARVFAVACAGAVLVATLIGAPRVFYSYHVSHFAILYVTTVAALAAFPSWRFLKAFWLLAGFVSVLAAMRLVIHHQIQTSFFDWISDLSGVLGGLVPMIVERFRALSGATGKR